MQSVKFVTIPTVGQGVLKVGSTTITAGQTIAAASLSTITFVPASNYNGNFSVTWQASDGVDLSNMGSLTITVNAVNDAPTTSDFSVATDEDVIYTFA